MAEKPHLNLIFTGHVDHGKSTLVGRILYETGALSENDLRKLKEEAAKMGKPTFEFAFAMDQLKEERERGVTIDIAHKDFRTAKYYFTIIDAPGHKDFVKNMITGASQADAAVLVCSAKEGVQAQTIEHAFLLKTLGVKQFIVAINKMDAVNNDRVKYEETKQALIAKIKPMGYPTDKIHFVPTSAYEGTNVTKKSDKTPWYAGPTMVEAFDMLEVPPKPLTGPLRLPIQEVFTITGQGTVPVGRVEAGTLKPNTTVIIMPEGITGEVKSIEMHHQALTQAIPGDNVGFAMKGVDKKAIRRGSVIGYPDNPPLVAEEFEAQIIVLNHPTAIGKNYTPVFHIHTAQLACTIVEIIEKKDPKTGATVQKNPDFIKTGDVAIVRIKPTRPVVVETFKDYPALGRFAMRDMGQTVAAGVVTKVTPKK
ncbi:translation elongation factor EF-1 subunit alpha [Candidatus Micrarchaeota archaeon CG10_big_fil_rev_8_21_14_0_10_59_7]|nr:MAG: translation elongation factor EF-1 subunit alpha [Candidatus Micrarchaeota archaeon CG10_big_fil_rev_8_21_14_0_10_59_7]